MFHFIAGKWSRSRKEGIVISRLLETFLMTIGETKLVHLYCLKSQPDLKKSLYTILIDLIFS